MKTIRVFPRKTKATPDDELARFDSPSLFDEADKIDISVTFTWDIPKAEQLYNEWKKVSSNIHIGGPAYNDRGGEFIPGEYIKLGYVMTSRGCPNNCWFCYVPRREGTIRELKIKEGYNLLDSNILACSKEHIKSVFAMLKKQKERPRFTGGLEAKRMEPWIAQEIVSLNPSSAYFAYDTPDDYEPLVYAAELLKNAGARLRNYSCYVLIGYKNDTLEKAELRLKRVLQLGMFPMAMLYNNREGLDDGIKWKQFQREWANRYIVGSKLRLNKLASSDRL